MPFIRTRRLSPLVYPSTIRFSRIIATSILTRSLNRRLFAKANSPCIDPLMFFFLKSLDFALEEFDFFLKVGKVRLFAGQFSNGDVEDVLIQAEVFVLKTHDIKCNVSLGLKRASFVLAHLLSIIHFSLLYTL